MAEIKKKKSMNKMIYDHNFYLANKEKYCKSSMFKYYSKKTDTSMNDIEEMLKSFGDIHTIQLLKKKVLELKVAKLIEQLSTK
jgi:hypothetical protein